MHVVWIDCYSYHMDATANAVTITTTATGRVLLSASYAAWVRLSRARQGR